MKNIKVITSILSAILLVVITLVILYSIRTTAENNSATVTFTASIVNPPCWFENKKGNLDIDCFDTTNYNVEHINLNKKIKSERWNELENNSGLYQFKWINEKNSMLTVFHY